jgi:hypothetical protein
MDLQIRTVKEEIRRYNSQYSARLSAHPNDLIVNLIYYYSLQIKNGIKTPPPPQKKLSY